jgi:hypothetical protein
MKKRSNKKKGGNKMSRLKNENLNKCVSLLREFIDEASTQGSKKEIAILALDQLQNITAGTTPPVPLGPVCITRPRADA